MCQKIKTTLPGAKDGYQQGIQLMKNSRYQEAIEAFTRAIDDKIKFAEAYFERGVCFYKLGNIRQAADDLAAAAVLGCEAAGFWSKYDRKKFQKSDNDNVSSR